jgi:hypothetical protein
MLASPRQSWQLAAFASQIAPPAKLTLRWIRRQLAPSEAAIEPLPCCSQALRPFSRVYRGDSWSIFDERRSSFRQSAF